jgi:glycosyltransferase involved in cell wall biosynthesis
MRKHRLLVLASHPIQYRSPLYRYLALMEWLDLEVWYGDDYGVRPRKSGWGVEEFMWDGDLLAGYQHRFLKNRSPWPDPSTIFGKINPSLPRELGRSKPDAVLIPGYMGLYQWLSFVSAWQCQIPILYTSDTNFYAKKSVVKERVKRAIIGPLYSRIDGFLVTGTSNRLHFEDYGVPAEKFAWCPWAIDNEVFGKKAQQAESARGELRGRWGASDSCDVLLYAGRFAEEKRPMDLLLAAQRLGNVHVVLAGGGPMREQLEAFAAAHLPGRCTLLGFVNQSGLPAVYAASDLLVLPSSYEPWGLVVNESLACGTPVIASSRVGAAYDLIPDQLRFEPGDIDGICRAVGHWRTQREHHGGDLRGWAKEAVSTFNFEQDALGLRQVLDRVVRGRGDK